MHEKSNENIEYNFTPDFKTWWKNNTTAHEDFSWVTLGIDPEAVKRLKEINTKTEEITIEELRFRGQLDDYVLNLPRGMFIKYTRSALMNLDWSKGKENFIAQAYEHNFEIHPDFCAYLQSIGQMPHNPDLERYKDHAQYRADLAEWNPENIKDEDAALSLLLGLNPEYFSQFLSLNSKMKEENRTADGFSAYYGFKPEEKWLFVEYNDFLKEEFPRLARDISWPMIHISPPLKKAKELNLWTGNFVAYVQSLHDNGFIFMPKTYAALEKHGIELAYSAGGWAMQFYQRFLRLGVWSLKDAANIYRGSDPHGGREFENLANTALHGSGAGLALETAETIAEFDDNDNFIPPPDLSLAYVFKKDDKTVLDRTYSLEGFVRGHMAAGNLTPAKDEGPEKLYFQPKVIVEFFRDYLPRSHRPKALYIALELDRPKKKKAQPISEAALEREYKKYINDCTSKNIIPSWERDWGAMESALGKRPTKKQIKAVRAKLAPYSWKQQGRRRAA